MSRVPVYTSSCFGPVFECLYYNPQNPYTSWPRDVFVMKFDPSGTRQWIRFLSTNDTEECTHIAVDNREWRALSYARRASLAAAEGNVVVVGLTRGSFTTTNVVPGCVASPHAAARN
jgi:hypothetical protein